ncbi:MAG: SDR family oxidoreductase [Actinomycetota bacterium]|nr:SDR family oxidoreductase [Actinomycetota bacterium]
MRDWLNDVFAGRPWWMNAVMVFCAWMTFVYVPWDLLLKSVEHDEEVWFGIVFTGMTAKVLTIPHWIVYAGGLYGFRQMRPWMALAAPAYTAQVAIGMFLWPMMKYGSLTGFVLGVISVVPFAALTAAFWQARGLFLDEPMPLAERYGGWAVVTGASAGIGAAFARACAREGMPVVLVARRQDLLEQLARELEEAHGVETRVVAIDLTERDAAERLAAAVADLDVGMLVNNAGFGLQGRFDSLDLARLEDMVQVNCAVPVSLTHRLLPALRARHRGAVVIVGSAAGWQPLPLHGVYSATKAFDQFFGESLSVELADDHIDVLVVEPGTVETEFQAVSGQLEHSGASPEDVVDTAFEALGRQPSVVVGWWNYLRAVIPKRLLTRPLVLQVARGVTEKHTPVEKR